MSRILHTIGFDGGHRSSFLTTVAISDLQKLAQTIITTDLKNIVVYGGDVVQTNAVASYLITEGVNTNNISQTVRLGDVSVTIMGTDPVVAAPDPTPVVTPAVVDETPAQEE